MSFYVRAKCRECITTIILDDEELYAIAEPGDVVERHCIICERVTPIEVLGDSASAPAAKASSERT